MSGKRHIVFGKIKNGSVTEFGVAGDRVDPLGKAQPRSKGDRAARARGVTVPPVEIRQF